MGLNNFLFCLLFLLAGAANSGKPRDAFWSSLFFQFILLAPLLVTFSVDTLHRLPRQRVDIWPITSAQRLLLTWVSFASNPLFVILFAGYLLWMGFTIALIFATLSFIVHVLVFAGGSLAQHMRSFRAIRIPRPPFVLGGIMQETARELMATLDFWAALLLAISGALYRLLAKTPDPEAFPIFALFVAIAMSTAAQRMLSLDDGKALLRYRLLPVAGWKLLLAQDIVFIAITGVMVSPLSMRAGLAFTLVALAAGRYTSIQQRKGQRRWRFTGGDPRFGIAQVLLGGLAGIGAVRIGLSMMVAAIILYIGSILFGQWLRKKSFAA